MRDHNATAVYVLGALAVIGGIVRYNTGSSASVARPTLVSTRPSCSTSLLGSVLGLLGSLLGGGGGC